jgi:hypothetical protein
MQTLTWDQYWSSDFNSPNMVHVEVTHRNILTARSNGRGKGISIWLVYPNNESVEYYREPGRDVLWTTDDDGNPKSRSVFIVTEETMENVYEALMEMAM